MINQVIKGKGKPQKPALKVMHIVDKNSDGTFSIGTNAPKLKEAVDIQQVSEETGHKPVGVKLPKKQPSKTSKTEKPKDELNEEQVKILKALVKLGGTSTSMPIAKECGFTKTHPDAPRAPVRDAMKHLADLHLVTSKREGIRYQFSVTEKGRATLTHKPTDPKQDKGANNHAPASTVLPMPVTQPSKPTETVKERPANTDRICSKCSTANPFMAEFCKNCGEKLQQVQTVSTAA